MIKKTKNSAIFAVLLALPLVVSADTWDGGGADTDYSNGLNWSSDVVPGGDAEILTGVSVTLGAAETTSGTLRVGSGAGSTLTVNAGGSLLNLGRLRIAEAGSTLGTVTLAGGDMTVAAVGGQGSVGVSGVGILNVPAGRTWTNTGGNNNVLGYNATGIGTINLAGNLNTTSANLVVGRAGAGIFTVTGSGAADINHLIVGNFGGGQGTLTIEDDGRVDVRSGTQSHIGRDGRANLNLSDNAVFNTLNTRDISFANQNSSAATVTIDDNATLSSGGAMFFAQSGNARATVTQNGGLVQTRNSNLVLARANTARATYTLNDGTVSVASTLFVGRANSTHGVFNQNGGNVIVGANLNLGSGSATAHGTYTMTAGTLTIGSALGAPSNGTFLLNGGTLKVDNIDSNLDSFTWGAGTLASRQVADLNNMVSNIDLTTTAGSTLDLGTVYLSGGPLHEGLTVNGTLDLTAGGDILDAIGTVQLLRPTGTGLAGSGSINLVTATSILGQFDTFNAPSDNIKASLFDPMGNANSLAINTYFLDYGTSGEINFLYRISGVAPEPTTVSLLGVATVLLRVLRRKKYAYDA